MNTLERFKQSIPAEHVEMHRQFTGLARAYNLEKLPATLIRLFSCIKKIREALGATLKNGDLDLSKIRGLEVLDLACGSGRAFHDLETKMARPLKRDFLLEDIEKSMEPWIPRILTKMGARVTGVDKWYPTYRKERLSKREKRSGSQAKDIGYSESGWTFHQRDLTEPGAIDSATFPDGSFDVVNCLGFIGYEGEVFEGNDPAMQKLYLTQPTRYFATLNAIRDGAHRVLKPSGRFIWNDNVFEEKDGKLVLRAVRR